MRRILAVGLLALAVAACSSSAGSTNNPAGVPGGAGASTAAVGTQGSLPSQNGGDTLGGVDPAGLASLTSEKVCTLLTSAEAGTIMGVAIDGTPSGMLVQGLGTNCLYRTAYDASGNSSLIKVEFNTLGYKSSIDILKLAGTPQSLTVGGRPAMGIDAPADPTSLMKAQLYVSLIDDPNGVGLYIEAPTLAMAKQVGEMVVPRIATLK